MIFALIRRPTVGRVCLWLVALSSVLVAADYLNRRAGHFGYDFGPTFWEPWQAIRSGLNPYPDPAIAANGNPFLYPPLAAELTLPLSWLSFDAAAFVFSAALAVSAGLTLWALDVRRPELWAMWMLSAAVVGPVAAGNATLFVVLAVALTWRWRDRPIWAATALAAGLVLKLFVWPVWLWLVFTRRYRAAIYSGVATLVLVLVPWAFISFRGLTDYPAALDNATEYLGTRGLLAYALIVKAASPEAGLFASAGVAIVLLAAAFARRNNDRASVTLALLATLYATPILWLHYFGLLIIPAALYGGWVWATIPLLALAWLSVAGAPRPGWMIACFIAITGAVSARALVGHSFGSPVENAEYKARLGSRDHASTTVATQRGLSGRSAYADE